jgi:hypothetical protein
MRKAAAASSAPAANELEPDSHAARVASFSINPLMPGTNVSSPMSVQRFTTMQAKIMAPHSLCVSASHFSSCKGSTSPPDNVEDTHMLSH